MERQEQANDIVQDCFVKLWQLRNDFIYLHQVKSFLYTSVRNKALNEGRTPDGCARIRTKND